MVIKTTGNISEYADKIYLWIDLVLTLLENIYAEEL